ncbi:MAG TPA: single-stranded DNA-binding protein [Terriglobales bacterium]|nr:single-stranded DNA-binding protein [Terriglobales bacterium]
MALYKNTIQLKGFVGKDAETKSVSNGNSLTVFSLATKSSFKDKQSDEWVSHTEWHRIVCFGKPAEFAKELKKGDYAEVEGELRSSEYEANGDKSFKRRSWEVRASSVRRLQRPERSGHDPIDDEAA